MFVYAFLKGAKYGRWGVLFGLFGVVEGFKHVFGVFVEMW